LGAITFIVRDTAFGANWPHQRVLLDKATQADSPYKATAQQLRLLIRKHFHVCHNIPRVYVALSFDAAALHGQKEHGALQLPVDIQSVVLHQSQVNTRLNFVMLTTLNS
jgi:hypothetical protein